MFYPYSIGQSKSDGQANVNEEKYVIKGEEKIIKNNKYLFN